MRLDRLKPENPWINALLWLLLLALAVLAFAYHAQICIFPYQLSPSEAGFYQSVRALRLGLNPWAPENAPEYFNDYGFIYPWAAKVLKDFLPALPLLALLRLLTGACLLLELGLLFLLLRQGGVRRREALAACLCVYAAQLFSDTPYARADGMTVLFFVLGLFLALRPGAWGALAAGLLAGMGYYVKPQVLLIMPVAMLMLWTQRRWRESAWVLLGAALGWLTLFTYVRVKFPYYFEGTYYIHLNMREIWYPHMLKQLQALAVAHAPALVAAALGLGLALSKRLPYLPKGAALTWAAAALAVLGIFALGPGAHVGAWLTYYNQQFLPLFYVFLLLWLQQLGFSRSLLTLLLLLSALQAFRTDLQMVPPKREEDWKAYQAADAWIAAHPHGIYPPIFSTLVIKNQAVLIDTDHSHCLPYSQHPGQHSLADAYFRRLQWADSELKQRKMQSVICGGYWPCLQTVADSGYVQVDPASVGLERFPFLVWLPPSGRPGGAPLRKVEIEGKKEASHAAE
jgi:hypothetical protein